MRLTVVGCSGSLPGPGSAASCYLLEADGPGEDGIERAWRVLLDLGSGALGPLQQYVDPMSLDAVLLSHLHADHCLDLCGLYVMVKHSPVGPSPRPRVPVWGPSGTAARLAGAYDLPVDPGMSAELDVQTWADGETVRIGPFAVTPMRVNHPVEAYGMRIEHDGVVLAYTGDTDSCDALKPLCHNATMVLADAAFVDGRDEVEGIHLSGRRAAQAVLDAEGVQRLVLTHLPPWNDAGVCVAQARELWDGPLDVAAPGRTSTSSLDGMVPDLTDSSVRVDGRTQDQLRPVTITRSWLDHAEGSVLVEFGRTRVLCAASFTAGVPRWRKGSGQGWVTAEYAMLPRSTNTRNDRESVKGRIGGRTHEISRLVGRSLRAVIDTKALGENTIVLDCDVLQADGGTRTAAITGAYVALADAIENARGKGLVAASAKPLSGSVAAVSVGIVGGRPLLDLCYDEDVSAGTDMNVVMTGDGRYVEVQGTAEGEAFDRTLLDGLLDLAAVGCAELTELQRAALEATT